MSSAADIIDRFSLVPHPFDGWFAPVETTATQATRYYFLLKAPDYAAWHRLGGRQLFTHIDGAPVTISWSTDGTTAGNRVIGAGQASTFTAEANVWRTLESVGSWSLLLVSVTDGANFLDWDLAPENWYPRPGQSLPSR